MRPKATYPVIAELASQGFSAKRCCRILGVAASGFFIWPYPSVRIRVGCWQDPDARVGWGWLSCWLPVMACDAAPPAPPLFLDR